MISLILGATARERRAERAACFWALDVSLRKDAYRVALEWHSHQGSTSSGWPGANGHSKRVLDGTSYSQGTRLAVRLAFS